MMIFHQEHKRNRASGLFLFKPLTSLTLKAGNCSSENWMRFQAAAARMLSGSFEILHAFVQTFAARIPITTNGLKAAARKCYASALELVASSKGRGSVLAGVVLEILRGVDGTKHDASSYHLLQDWKSLTDDRKMTILHLMSSTGKQKKFTYSVHQSSPDDEHQPWVSQGRTTFCQKSSCRYPISSLEIDLCLAFSQKPRNISSVSQIHTAGGGVQLFM
eukprot:755150-Hanusia_phi.AAC.4